MITIEGPDAQREVASLAPYLRRSLALGQTMDASRMTPEDADACRWIGFGIGKGVTHPGRDISAYGIPRRLRSALHGELVQPFGGADTTPACYDRASARGFGGFLRWVWFAGPRGNDDALGVDWSLAEAPHIGVATRATIVCTLARTLVRHGVPERAELALIGPAMCESPDDAAWRHADGLVAVRDWSAALDRFGRGTGWCETCGRGSFLARDYPFCSHCGTRRPGGTHGLET